MAFIVELAVLVVVDFTGDECTELALEDDEVTARGVAVLATFLAGG